MTFKLKLDKINRTNNIEHHDIKFIDLFCGIGGFHLALTSIPNINAKCVFASEIDIHCKRIYEYNFKIKPYGDILQNIANIPNFDILCAGFPCQPFSNAGNKKGLSDKKGLLFDSIVEILKIHKPKLGFLENVKHIKNISNGEVYKYIYQQITNLGYNMLDFEISPLDINIPQNRKRIIFILIRNDITYNKKDIIKIIEQNIIKYKEINKNNIILDHIDNSKYNLSSELLNVLLAWDELTKILKDIEIISPIVIDYFYDQAIDENNKKWKNEYIKKNILFYHKYKHLIDPWLLKYKQLLTIKSIYGKLEWQTGTIGGSIFDYYIQIRQSGIRVKKTDCFPALVAIVQTSIIGEKRRYLTPKECSRLQSFPDTFSFIDQDDKITYKQLGNSVNVKIIKVIIESTLNFLEKSYVKKD